MAVDLKTKYLGLELKNPVVVAASPLSDKTANLKRLEEAGAAAIVLHSLFEEQIEHEAIELTEAQAYGAEFYAEHSNWYPELDDYKLGPKGYLEHIEEVKKALTVPVIASLNGTSKGGWLRYAQLMQEAGADALELNIYFVAADMDMTAEDVEQKYLDLVGAVKHELSIPVAVKVGPYFSSPGHMCKRIVDAGANGLVLFNRFLQPDIDLESLEISNKIELSTAAEMRLPMRWIAILYGRVNASLALTSGIHSATDMLKAIAAGADVGMVVSALYQQGFGFIGQVLQGMQEWLEEKEYVSIEQLRGAMSQQNCPDPAAFERGNYMKALTSYTATTSPLSGTAGNVANRTDRPRP